MVCKKVKIKTDLMVNLLTIKSPLKKASKFQINDVTNSQWLYPKLSLAFSPPRNHHVTLTFSYLNEIFNIWKGFLRQDFMISAHVDYFWIHQHITNLAMAAGYKNWTRNARTSFFIFKQDFKNICYRNLSLP